MGSSSDGYMSALLVWSLLLFFDDNLSLNNFSNGKTFFSLDRIPVLKIEQNFQNKIRTAFPQFVYLLITQHKLLLQLISTNPAIQNKLHLPPSVGDCGGVACTGLVRVRVTLLLSNGNESWDHLHEAAFSSKRTRAHFSIISAQEYRPQKRDHCSARKPRP